MKVEFADSFFESLKRLNRHGTWWYKLWHTISYNIPNFFKNIWYFRKELYDFEAWDYRFNLNLFQRSLEATADYIEHRGYEVDESRLKKVAKMRRVIKLLDERDYIDQAEAELGELKNVGGWLDGKEDTLEEREHNSKVFKRAHEIEEQNWNELWDILKGKPYTTEEEYDGSNLRGWWD